MLSYRHSFHAGNFADVIKHTVLLHCLEYMTQKEKPLRLVDTHAGAGFYQLTDSGQHKNREYSNGIGKLWQRSDLPAALKFYVERVASFNKSEKLTAYPGSPALCESVLREKDRLFCHEIHPTDFRLLQDRFSSNAKIKLVEEDGLVGMQALLPPPDRRGLVFIDPSYEVKSDYFEVIEKLLKAHKRFATGTFVLWYPVVLRERIDSMQKSLINSGIKNIVQIEFGIAPDDPDYGMNSSGLFVINPPWTLWAAMEETLPYLVDHLAETGQGFYKLDQLVAE